MTKLKLSALLDDRPVKVTTQLDDSVPRELDAYAAILAKAPGEPAPPDPVKLIGPMLQRFMATDKAFNRAKRLAVAVRPGKAGTRADIS